MEIEGHQGPPVPNDACKSLPKRQIFLVGRCWSKGRNLRRLEGSRPKISATCGLRSSLVFARA